MYGMELFSDSGRGVYVVVGFSCHYYHNGYFFRLRGGIWEISPKPDGHWKVTSDKSLPNRLRVKVKSTGNGRDKGKG